MNVQDFFHRRKFRVWPSVYAGYGRFGHSLYLLYIENIKIKYIDVIIIYRSTECLPSVTSVAFYEAGNLRISSLVHHLSVSYMVCSLSVFLCAHLWFAPVRTASLLSHFTFQVSGFNYAMP